MAKILFGREDSEKFEEKDKLRFVIASFKRCKKYYSCDNLAILIDIYLRRKIRRYLRKHRGNLFIDLK